MRHLAALALALCTACASETQNTPFDASTDATGSTDATADRSDAKVDAALDAGTDVLDAAASDASDAKADADACVAVVYGPLDPGSAVDLATIGTRPWSSANKAITSDDQRAEVSAMINGEVSHYLWASGYGFTLPSTATITGIEVAIERSALSGVGIVDNEVRLTKGAVLGTAKAANGVWGTSETVITYGGPNDMWGTTLTPADVNLAGFGVALSTKYPSVSGNDWPRVDVIRVTIYTTCN